MIELCSDLWSSARYYRFTCRYGVWILIFCARSALAMDQAACISLLGPDAPRPQIRIRAGVDTSILLFSGPRFELDRHLLAYFPEGSQPRDPDLPKLELYYNEVHGVGAIVSRLGDPHEYLIEILIEGREGTVPIGGVRWYSNKPGAGPRINSTILKHLPGPELADRYFDTVILEVQKADRNSFTHPPMTIVEPRDDTSARP